MNEEHRCPSCDGLLVPKGDSEWKCPNPFHCPEGVVEVES
jgi:NAD-dependent DNA ligase